ncbi:TOBE domain-containing protein [Niveibacterium sp. SC-1]|uniref:TOBE domain-containing protein n=1 Tax=Niveibacterium sp. SC-1 TaxID=3135646 RepID=UPI00311DC7C9
MTLQLDGRIWLARDGEMLAGRERFALLRALGETGSISAAARALRMSYKHAWDTVETMNRVAGEALVTSSVGGKGGGGARLTARALALLDTFSRAEAAHQQMLESLSRQLLGEGLDAMALRQTSARNQLEGIVSAVRPGKLADEIEVSLGDGERLFATVTHASTQALDLRPQRKVVALFKAGAIALSTDASSPAGLRARVTQVARARGAAEIDLLTPGGHALHAAMRGTADQLRDFVPGVEAWARVPPSQIILGLR